MPHSRYFFNSSLKTHDRACFENRITDTKKYNPAHKHLLHSHFGPKYKLLCCCKKEKQKTKFYARKLYTFFSSKLFN